MAGRYGLQPRSYKRFPRRERGGGQDEIKFDESKSRVDHMLEILENVCVKAGVSDHKKIQYLSALIKLLSTVDPRDGITDLGLRIKEILLCLRIPLLSDNGDVRSATLRSVRYLVKCFPPILVKSLIAVTQKGEKKKDNFRRASLALLCQLSCQNPSLFVYSGCVRYLRQILFCQDLPPNIIETIIGCLLRLYNIPWFRDECGLDLSCLVGPFTELRLRGENEKPEDARIYEIRLQGASTALLSMLRSWSGILHLNNPSLITRPIQTLVEVLTIQTHQSRKVAYETRRLVLDIIYKSLNLQVPDWTEEFDVAMQTADPSDPKESWKLAEGFVAAEGRDIFPHLSKSRPNLIENHFCLLLSCYLECKLPSALIDVITSSDTVLSVRATVLLGQLLHLVTQLLPREVGTMHQCLPEIADRIAMSSLEFNKQESVRAASAVSALQRLHAMKKFGPRPQSLLLQQAVQFSGFITGESFVGDRLSLPAPTPSSAPLSQSTSVAIENATMAGVKESQVIPNRDPQSWKWEAVMSVLRWPSEGLKRLEDSNYKIFIKKLTDYFKPSSNMFSRLELATQRTRDHARIGASLIDFLVSSIVHNTDIERRTAVEPDSSLYLDELLADIFECVKEVIGSASAHDCMLSPSRISNTACQLYFLFIGRLTSTEQGRMSLERQDARSMLLSLLGNRMDVYLKLVVSCVDYRSVDWRVILSKALSGHSEAGRLYTIRWLGVLARMGFPSFSQFGIELLVEQLKDNSLQVSVAALTVLEEVCDDKMYLEALVAAKSSLLCESGHKALQRLGPRGRVLLVRFLLSSSGFNVMYSIDWLKSELAYWAETFNKKFVLMVEGLLNDCFTLHQRSLDGFGMYGRRSSEQNKDKRDAYVPPHLYGQLAQTGDGFDVLLKETTYWKMMDSLRELDSVNFHEIRPSVGLPSSIDSSRHSSFGMEEVWLEYKAAIWALGSVAASNLGAAHLEKQGIINILVNVAENCNILSLKGTAFYALGLVATTREGALALGSRGWATVRHSRSETWPIAYEWWECAEDCMMEQQEANSSVTATVEPDNNLDDSWIVEDRPTILIEESIGTTSSRESSTQKSRRKKTTSECTEDSIASQTILETGRSSAEPQASNKFTEKITNWFAGSSNGTNTSKSEPRTSGVGVSSRRLSDSGRLGSSIAKIRNSFRRRSKTLSSGCTPPEGTPVSSTGGGTKTDEDEGSSVGGGFGVLSGLSGGGGLKLNFSMEEASSVTVIPASPDTMPGEIFSMEKILEEPCSQSTPVDHAHQKKAVKQVVRRRTESEGPATSTGIEIESPVSSRTNIQLDTSRSSHTGKELPDPSGDQMDTSITSISSGTGIESKDISRIEGSMGIAFTATKHEVHSNIKPGTSASSVSSYGSLGQRGVYDPYGLGSLARTRIKRRPQLSESEDGDHSVVSGSGHPPALSLSRQDSNNWSLEYRHLHRNPSLVLGKRMSIAETIRTLPMPLVRPAINITRTEKDSTYWGLVFPLNSKVIYPPQGSSKPGSPHSLDLPVMVGALLNSSHRHSPANCLSCCRLQPSARPRAASLSITKDDIRSSLLLSGSLPSSNQSPEVKRKSWNPSLTTSNNQLAEGNGKNSQDSIEPPINFDSAKTEALDFIGQLNSLRFGQQAEIGLNKLRGRVPKVFQDLCFYSDVCAVLTEYDYKANARKFIHQLFTPVNTIQMEIEAKNIIYPSGKPITTTN